MALTEDVKTILGIDESEYDSKLALFIPFAEELLRGKGVQDITSHKYKIAVAIIVSEKMDGKSNFSEGLDSIILQLKYCYIATPEGLTAAMNNGVVELNWLPNTESTLEGYKIYQNSIEIGSITINSYRISGLAIGSYLFQVSAFDDSGNTSKLTKPVILEVK